MAARAFHSSRSSTVGATCMRPNTTSPIVPDPVFDPEACSKPIAVFDSDHIARTLPETVPGNASAASPAPPPGLGPDEYLYPSLTRNELLRLTTLWYHTRHALQDDDLISDLQIKVDLVREFLGWDFAICGVLDSNTFTRVTASGIATAVLPRRESTCAHTIQNVAAGAVFQVADMSKDWRFRASPHVDKGGLRSYAGTSIVCQVDDGDSVAIGSLCVASLSPNKILSASQQAILVRFANMVSNEIINKSRSLRREQQQYMHELLSSITSLSDIEQMEPSTLSILQQVYPTATITVCGILGHSLPLSDEQLVPLSDFHDGIWADSSFIDTMVITQNQMEPSSTRVVRALASVLQARATPRALVVASSDARLVFDDIDAWFVDSCSTILNRVAQERMLIEARLTKERFLRGITHQLRTPIHGVLGSVDLLAEELASRNLLDAASRPTDDRSSTVNGVTGHGDMTSFNAADVLRTIQNSGRELMSTVNNILRLNRWAELVKADTAAVISDLASLEETLLDDTRRLLPEYEVDRLCVYFDNQLPENTSTTMLDTGLVKECLQSLILNSFQFTRMGCLVVAITCADDCSSISFDVKDTGQGIRAENHGRVFEEYEKEDVHSRGAGLGLTLASKIASAMSGSVELIASAPHQGSHFRLSFRDPRLGCRIDFPKTLRATASWTNLKKFSTIPTNPPTITVRHFTRYLERCGLEKSSCQDDSLTIVTYIPVPSMFDEYLKAAVSVVGVSACLVPRSEDTEKLAQNHPNIRFFNGPFTSKRIREIMTELDRASAPADEVSDSMAELTVRTRRPIVAKESMTILKQARLQGRPNALLVDDNAINLQIFRMYCDKRSHPYRSAMDGFEAIAQYKEALEQTTPVSLILLDLQMPNCDGLQACVEIRRIEKESQLTPAVVFIVTGQDSPTDRARALEAGANEFYVKPMSLKTLDRAIAQYFHTLR